MDPIETTNTKKDNFLRSLMWNMLMVELILGWLSIKSKFDINVNSCTDIGYPPYLNKEMNMVVQKTRLHGINT